MRPSQVGVLCYSPLQQALLSGKYINSEQVPEGRRRSRLFALDSTATSRHGWPGVEDELFSPGASAPHLGIPDGANMRYGGRTDGVLEAGVGRRGKDAAVHPHPH